MKTRIHSLWIVLVLLAGVNHLTAQGTVFTYQGRLNDGAAPAAGTYDLQFAIYDVAGGGAPIAGPLTNSATVVTNGLFTVSLDFGAGAFPGADRWLQIAVRTNGAAVFTNLAPRQKFTATPYAITAGNLTGTVPVGQLSPNVALLDADQTFTGENDFNSDASSPQIVVQKQFYGISQQAFDVNLSTYVNLTGGWLGTVSEHPLFFFVGDGNPSMTVDVTGFVGIGTDSLGTELEVNGTVTAGSFSGSGAELTDLPADAVSGGLTTNIVLAPGGVTNILFFTNGILRAVQ